MPDLREASHTSQLNHSTPCSLVGRTGPTAPGVERRTSAPSHDKLSETFPKTSPKVFQLQRSQVEYWIVHV